MFTPRLQGPYTHFIPYYNNIMLCIIRIPHLPPSTVIDKATMDDIREPTTIAPILGPSVTCVRPNTLPTDGKR